MVLAFFVSALTRNVNEPMDRAIFSGEISGKAVFYMLVPLIVLGVSKLSARMKKESAKNVSKAMWITWAIISVMSILGGSGKGGAKTTSPEVGEAEQHRQS